MNDYELHYNERRETRVTGTAAVDEVHYNVLDEVHNRCRCSRADITTPLGPALREEIKKTLKVKGEQGRV